MAILKELLTEPAVEGIGDSTPVQAYVEDSGNSIAIDYSLYYERMAAAAEAQATAMQNLVTAAQAQQSAVEEIRDIINGSQEVAGGGIPMKDVYASLSYSALIKVFEEEGVDVDALIAKTQTKLDGIT